MARGLHLRSSRRSTQEVLSTTETGQLKIAKTIWDERLIEAFRNTVMPRFRGLVCLRRWSAVVGFRCVQTYLGRQRGDAPGEGF